MSLIATSRMGEGNKKIVVSGLKETPWPIIKLFEVCLTIVFAA